MSKCLVKILVQHPRVVPYWDTILGHMHRASQNIRHFIVLSLRLQLPIVLVKNSVVARFGVLLFSD